MTGYEPILIDTRMSDYGYWIVTFSIAPGKRLSIMIAIVGITRENAAQEALATLSSLPPGGGT
jgi:hypothetical protein